jgi:sensor c-di-GMP phosphodiesterase-like protein
VGSSRRKIIVAVVAGSLLAGLPMLAFNLWLDHLIDRQGREDVDGSVHRIASLAENRIAVAIKQLAELNARGVSSCAPISLREMRQASFLASPIKELSVVGADGRTLCTDLGLALGPRQVIASQPAGIGDNVLIEYVRVGARPDAVVRVRRLGVGDAPGLAALIPKELFLPAVSTQGGRFNAFARMQLRDGTIIAQTGSDDRNREQGNFVATAASKRYGLRATITASRQRVLAAHQGLHAIGMVITGVIALIILSFALLMPMRGDRANPVTEIERAMAAGEFVPYFQPVVDIKTGQLRGAEVLIRWRKRDGSIVSPGAFIPLVESSGLILQLTDYLMRRVLEEVGEVLGRRPQLMVSFNMAARHFNDDAIVRDICEIFEDSPLALSQIVLEVTERQPLENLSETRRVIAALQGLGVRIAIDDVGTGHNGLTYMLKLGVDIIKIDKVFVDAIGIESNSTTIIETLIDLANNMRMDVIAEGIETFEQVTYLRALGVRAVQGYVFAPALPASSFLQLVEAIEPLSERRIDLGNDVIAVPARLATA